MATNDHMYRHDRPAAVLLAIVLIAGIGTAIHASRAAAATEGDSGPVVSGYLSLRSVVRSAETDSQEVFRDQDLYGELRLDVTNIRSGRFEFHFLGAVRDDLDGKSDVKTFDPLEDIGNTHTSDVMAQLYEAHLDINDLFTGLPQVRLGRQASTRDQQVFFDGAALDLRPARFLSFTLYGGLPVNFFEVDGEEGKDTVAGGGVDIAAGSSTGISVDYLAIHDDRTYFDDRSLTDRLWSFKVWQRFSRNVKATAKLRYQNGESRDLNVRLLGVLPEQGAEIGATYVRQFHDQAEQTNALSPFYDVMGTSHPYQSIDVRLRKLFGARYAVDLGYFQRELIKSAESGTFNREYARASAGFQVNGFLFSQLSLLVTGERWDSEEQGFSSAGADLTYAFGRSGKAGSLSLGTYYSLYKYDESLQEERDRVRTYYLKGRAALATQLSLTAAYELERSIDRYQTAKLGVRYDF